MDVDTSLPLDSNNLSSKTAQSKPSQLPFPDLKPEMVVEALGGLIVNSITIHALAQDNGQDPPEPVAVISNNDQTVKIWSLVRRQQITELSHPNCMNYALISPDSNTLVAVGDENRAYFYQREIIRSQIVFSAGKTFRDHRWKLFAKPRLPSDGHHVDDCCFTAAFSPRGHLCAVAAQNGMITVFDMERLVSLGPDEAPESSILHTFRSSRPRGFVTGAVRAMAFSPDPWDLLLWAEQYGRVGIADVRQAFVRRQIVKLETHAIDMERITPQDLTNPRLRELDPESRMMQQFNEAIGLDEDDQLPTRQWIRSRHEHLPLSDERGSLTERERQLIESIQTTQSNMEDAESMDTTSSVDSLPTGTRRPYSVNYTSSPRVRASLAQADESRSEEARSRSARLRAMMGQFMRTMDNDRSEDRIYQPRRRSSVILSQGNSANSSNNLAPMSNPRSRMTASPSRLSQNEMDVDESRPHSVSAALEASGAFSDNVNTEPSTGSGSYDSEFFALIRRQRAELPNLEHRIAQQQRQLEQLQREMSARIHAPSHPAARRWATEIGGTRDDESELAALRELARGLEPFDPTGIPPEEVSAQEELHDRRRNDARDYADHVRHVLFAGQDTSAQSSALPTTNLISSLNSEDSSTADTYARRLLQSRRQVLDERLRQERTNREQSNTTTTRRPSTPSNPQTINRNRSQSPTSRALVLARNSHIESINPTTSSYAEAADSSRRRQTISPTTQSTYQDSHTLTRVSANRPAPPSSNNQSQASMSRLHTLSNSIREARVMAMHSAAARMMDGNGNWLAGSDGSPYGMLRGWGEGSGDGAGSMGESWSERGVGTAGVGWSRDGRNL